MWHLLNKLHFCILTHCLFKWSRRIIGVSHYKPRKKQISEACKLCNNKHYKLSGTYNIEFFSSEKTWVSISPYRNEIWFNHKHAKKFLTFNKFQLYVGIQYENIFDSLFGFYSIRWALKNDCVEKRYLYFDLFLIMDLPEIDFLTAFLRNVNLNCRDCS